ncbi:MAG: ATP-binding protein [Nocardioidaceae bacterium]
MGLRNPARALAGHLMWTRSGTVIATWRLRGIEYGFRPDKDKIVARQLHQGLFRALPGESALYGVRAGIDPAAVVSRMLADLDLDACPAWVDECAATLDTLDELPLGERQYWLSVPLRSRNLAAMARQVGQSALIWVHDALALPRSGVSEDDLATYAERARQIEMLIPAPFQPKPATPAQHVWLSVHGQRRGLFTDPDLPTESEAAVGEAVTAGCAAPEPVVDEGGRSDVVGAQSSSWWQRAGARARRWNPLNHRYVKVSSPDVADDPSYQAMLVLADVPPGGMRFPGSEFLGRLDESGLDVDWVIRAQQRSSAEAASANRRALNRLSDQVHQREDELSVHMSQLDRVSEMLGEYLAVLEGDKNEVEIQATVILGVAGPTEAEANNKAKMLCNYFSAADYRLSRPIGYQSQLWWAMVPGTPHTRVLREYAQITTSRALSAAVPVTSTELGDRKGIKLAQNICSPGLPGVVLIDPEGTTEADVSGSIGFCGDLGGGKSAAMKVIAGAIADRGGRLVVIDPSRMGEWAVFADSVTEAVVVDVADPAYSLDTLQLFGPAAGARVTQSFLTPLLRVTPTSNQGVLLSEVLEPEYLVTHGISRLGDLLEHLRNGCELPGAGELARLINVFAKKDLGRVMFDATLPPVPTDAPGIVIRTHTLELPSATDLTNAHLFDEMSVEKIFGRALYAQLSNLAKEICFSDRSRLGAFVCDEFRSITCSPEGAAGAEHFVIQGRKDKAVLIAGSPSCTHLGDENLRNLFPTRVVMRTQNRTEAAKALAWADFEPTEDNIEMLTTDTSPRDPATDQVPPERRGEALIRDAKGNSGRIKVDLPARQDRALAILTTPTGYTSHEPRTRP